MAETELYVGRLTGEEYTTLDDNTVPNLPTVLIDSEVEIYHDSEESTVRVEATYPNRNTWEGEYDESELESSLEETVEILERLDNGEEAEELQRELENSS